MKKLLLVIIPALLLMGMSTANAASMKIGVMNVQTIMEKAPQMVTLREQMKKEFQPREAKLMTAEKSLQADMEKLNKNGPVMKANDKKALEGKISKERSDLMKNEIKFRGDVMKAQNEGLKKFLDQLNEITQKLAKKDDYSLILRREGVPYVDDSLDVTDQVLDALKKAA